MRKFLPYILENPNTIKKKKKKEVFEKSISNGFRRIGGK